MNGITIRKYEKPNCVPCRMLDNYLREKDVEVEKVDVTTLSPEEIDRLNLSGVPTVIFYRNGIEMARTVGLAAIDEFDDCLKHAKEGR